MKRSGIEELDSGIKINWDSHHSAKNPSAKNNYQRLIQVTCISCDKWRWINSCCLWEYRKGLKRICWECHKKQLAERNSTKTLGRHVNTSGYIVRTLSSFTDDELKIISPMMRSPSAKRRKNHTEILEHRAIMALSLGRPLSSKEVIHHVNGIKDDNRIENLELHQIGTHSKTYAELMKENKELRLMLEKAQQLDLVLTIEND